MHHENFKNRLIQKTIEYEKNNSSKNPIFYSFQIFRLTLLKTSLNILDYKELMQGSIFKSLTTLNLFCFWLSVAPILWFLIRLPIEKGDSKLSAQFFTQNLPGFSNSENHLNWETFIYPFDYTEALINDIEKISFDNEMVILKNKNNINSFNTFLEVEENENKGQLKEFSPRQVLTEKKVPNFDLDEIPLKLEGVKNNNPLVKPLFAEALTHSDSQNHEPKNFKFESSLILNDKNTVADLKLLNSQKYFHNQTVGDNLLSDFSKKELETTHLIFQAQENLNNYIKDQIVKLSKFSSNFEFNKLETNLVNPRSSTGYRYPDMKISEVFKAKLVELPSSSHENQENLLIRLTPPTGALVFGDSNKKETTISKPILEIKSTIHSDNALYYVELDEGSKDIRVKNKFIVKQDVLEKLIQNNSVTLNQQYFFGNLTDEELKESVIKLNYAIHAWESAEKEKVSYDVSVFSEVEKTLFSVFDPKMDTSKNAFFYQAKTNDLLGNKITKLIPILIFHQSDVQNLVPLTIGFNVRDLNSFQQTPLLSYPFQQLTNLVDLRGSSYSNSSLAMPRLEQLGLMEYSASSYKREVGLYWQNKLNLDKLGGQEFFKDSNQAITSESLFGISLIGFFLSMVSILRTAYSDYAKELSSYLLDVISSGKGLPLDPSTIEWLNEELGLEEKKGGIRIFPKGFSNKRFTEIAGIKNLLPELSELVWFLRNKGRKFSITRLTTKSILLVGPPGTGKTLLVQTLAAEANVPVVAQSTNMLSSIGKDLTPSDAIRMAFEKARSLAPAILFLDELDSLGTKRDSLLTNPVDDLNLSTTNGTTNGQNTHKKFYQNLPGNAFEDFEMGQVGVENAKDLVSNQLRINITNQVNKKLEQERDQISALTQLLVEIDGLQSNTGVLVIGATNRPAVLDPALTRPGRFSKVISVPLPDKAKRVEIIKLYAKHLGWENNISWNYLSKCTQGFSAGDLAAMTNQSGIQAILNGTKHTVETFEHAIKILTTYPTEKVDQKNYFSLTQKTYYKTSQILLSYLLNSSNQPAFVELTPRQPNPRAFQIKSNFISDEDRLRTRNELETILISLVAGKAGEILLLLNNYSEKYSYWESDLAKYDLYEASKTAITMISDWYFYSEGYRNLFNLKFTSIPPTLTDLEYRNQDEVLEFLKEMSVYLDQELTTQFRLPDLPVPFESLFQTARWKVDVTQELTSLDPTFSEWTRFHLPDPQQTERNPEWIPPEEHYSQVSTAIMKNNQSSVELERLMSVYIEKYLHYLLLMAFNKAFNYLNENRETLDSLSFTLLQKRFIRESEIKKLMGFHL